MSLISIVTPVYFSAPSLPDLLAAFQSLSARNPSDDFEFIFVDDGSKDNSLDVLIELSRSEKRMRVIKLSRNFGSIPAILAGMSEARGHAVAAISADLQDPPELIHDMIEHWHAGHKLIVAAREGRDDPFPTAQIADLFYALFRSLAIKTMPKRGFDFFLMDRQVCDLVNNSNESNTYLMGLLLWLGFDPVVMYYNRHERQARFGRSRWTFLRRIKYFIDAFVSFSYVPLRAASLLGVGLSIVGLCYAMVLVYLRLVHALNVEGWTSLMVVVLIVSGMQMIMMGIMGEYLWRTLDETRRRPRFVIERIIEAESRAHNK